MLNDRPCRVAQQTRDTIKDIAKQYNYKVNQTARSLVTRKSNILGLIIPDIENLFFSALCKRMEEYLRELGYALMIVNSNDHAADDSMLIDLLVSRGVDGLGITVSNESFQDETIRKKLASLSIPYVMIDRMYPDLNCSKVYFDNESGAYMAIEKLSEKRPQKNRNASEFLPQAKLGRAVLQAIAKLCSSSSWRFVKIIFSMEIIAFRVDIPVQSS